ncbi:hypothetical protein B484DRAFT_466928, partial [Ochromonadaceae sp. CCMP2298]
MEPKTEPMSEEELFASQDTETYARQGVTAKNEREGFETFNNEPILFENVQAPAAAAHHADSVSLVNRMLQLDMPAAPTHVPTVIPIELGRRRIQCMYPEAKDKIEDYADDSDNYDEDYDDTAKKKRKVKVSSTSSAKGRVYFSKSKKNTLRISDAHGHNEARAILYNLSWHKMDDAKVSVVSQDTVLACQAYILFYNKCTPLPLPLPLPAPAPAPISPCPCYEKDQEGEQKYVTRPEIMALPVSMSCFTVTSAAASGGGGMRTENSISDTDLRKSFSIAVDEYQTSAADDGHFTDSHCSIGVLVSKAFEYRGRLSKLYTGHVRRVWLSDEDQLPHLLQVRFEDEQESDLSGEELLNAKLLYDNDLGFKTGIAAAELDIFWGGEFIKGGNPFQLFLEGPSLEA